MTSRQGGLSQTHLCIKNPKNPASQNHNVQGWGSSLYFPSPEDNYNPWFLLLTPASAALGISPSAETTDTGKKQNQELPLK